MLSDDAYVPKHTQIPVIKPKEKNSKENSRAFMYIYVRTYRRDFFSFHVSFFYSHYKCCVRLDTYAPSLDI